MVEARLVVTALALMFAMFLAAVHGLRHQIGVVILALLSLSWFTVDKLFEGDVLIHVSKGHAVTTADFVGLLGLVVAALLWWHSRSVHRSRQAQPRPRPRPRPHVTGDDR